MFLIFGGEGGERLGKVLDYDSCRYGEVFVKYLTIFLGCLASEKVMENLDIVIFEISVFVVILVPGPEKRERERE